MVEAAQERASFGWSCGKKVGLEEEDEGKKESLWLRCRLLREWSRKLQVASAGTDAFAYGEKGKKKKGRLPKRTRKGDGRTERKQDGGQSRRGLECNEIQRVEWADVYLWRAGCLLLVNLMVGLPERFAPACHAMQMQVRFLIKFLPIPPILSSDQPR
jgi:hypothetical protein